MAIPIGTTERDVAAAVRWALVGVIVVGMLTWWSPGYHAWGALIGGVMLLWMLWLVWKVVAGDRTVPGHPLYLGLLIPAGILVYHLVGTGITRAPVGGEGLYGSLNMSMILHLGLIALGMMLTQSLFSGNVRGVCLLSVCGAAMTAGAVVSMVWGVSGDARSAIALVGFSGIAVWLSPLWGGLRDPEDISDSRNRELRLIYAGISVVAGVILAVMAPRAAVLAASVTGATLLLGLRSLWSRRRLLLTACCTLGLSFAAIVLVSPILSPLAHLSAGGLGSGENAFAIVSASDSGLVILVGTVGWVGMLGLVGSALSYVAWLNLGDRSGDRLARHRTVVWTIAGTLCGCALFSPGGMAIPSVTLALVLTWGLLPVMSEHRTSPQPGIVLVVIVMSLLLLLGVVRRQGLSFWAANAFGQDDEFLHAVTGFVMGMMLGWIFGVHRFRYGLVGIALGVLVGGAGELAQQTVSQRGFHWDDWGMHAVGALLAIVPYSLGFGSRWCESADAASREMLREVRERAP